MTVVPTGIAGYYNQTTGVLTVADETGGSGLWKIAKADGTPLLGVTEGNRRTFTIDPEDITQDANNNNVVYVKVYDQAGNTQQQAIVLQQDTEGPEVTVSYSGGKHYITATDNAGIWRITDTAGNEVANYGEQGRVIPQA